MRPPRASYANVMATLAALIAVGSLTGIAHSAPSSNEINACVNTQSGALRIVGSLANCDQATESALSWNQQGVAGAQGPPGPAGASVSGSAALPSNVAARLTRALAAIQTKLAGNELGDLSTQSQLKLQMSMDRVSKFYESLSNLLKKVDGTEQALIENLK